MQKKPIIQRKRDTKRAATIIETAELTGVSTRSVQRVLNAEQENEKVLSIFMTITEEKRDLLKRVKELVPFL